MNLVYKTYDISTDIEYTSGTRLNLSGVRIIKLINRPSGVQVWISTDSNGTNLFPLINRGDGWELPNDYEPLYNLYVFTKGVNSQDKLTLSYTGEKNFFIFGNNSIEKIGEVENLGELAQVSLNDAIFNTYSRKPLNDTNVIYSDVYCAAIDFEKKQGEYRYLSYIVQFLEDLGLNDNEFYRLSIFGHIDIGNDNITNADGWAGESSITAHLTLFNNNKGATLTKNTKYTNISNLYQLDKSPYDYKNYFDIFGLKFEGRSRQQPNTYIGTAFAYHNGATQLNYDLILLGKQVKKYASLGLFIHYNTNIYGTASLHASFLFTISQAITHINPNIISQFPAPIPLTPALQTGNNPVSVTYGSNVEIPLKNIFTDSTLNIQVQDITKGNAIVKPGTNNTIIYTPAANENMLTSISVSQTSNELTSKQFVIDIQIQSN